MKLAVVYDKDDHKLQDASYSWIYKGMLDAVVEKFNPIKIHEDCNAGDIDADMILFYDMQSSHHVRIDGIRTHPAVKVEYIIDPHQEEVMGTYMQFNKSVHKLGRRQRVARFFERGIDFVICPYRDGYYKYLGEFLGSDAEGMLKWFPPAPVKIDLSDTPRLKQILGNGTVRDGGKGFYDFRQWAFTQPTVSFVPHWIDDKKSPAGREYMDFISSYTGALALCAYYPVPKYFEIPMAGCVTFAQYSLEYEELGFEDMKSCVYVDKSNFLERTSDFLFAPERYRDIAVAGRRLVEEKYSAECFAEFIGGIYGFKE